MRISPVLTALLNAAALLTLVSCAGVSKSSPSQTASLSSPLPPPSQASLLRHTIKPGETLWRIASAYQVELEDIVLANKLQAASNIKTGQTLLIPCGKNRQNSPLTSTDNDNFIWPAKGKIVAYFRQLSGSITNKGIDILAFPGDDILASHDGRVAFSGHLIGYGPTLIIEHPGAISTVTCGRIASRVTEGDEVKQGMVIAKVNTTSSEPIHFEIRKKHRPQNPLFFLTP